ncbi:MAG: dockerin type I repeat-containing protein [Candidatus Zixiibacteriota bacterium]
MEAFQAILSLFRGDVDNNGSMNASDVTHLVAYLLGLGPEPFPSIMMKDCDCTGTVNMSDMTYLVAFLKGFDPPQVKPCYKYGLPETRMLVRTVWGGRPEAVLSKKFSTREEISLKDELFIRVGWAK